MIDVVKEFKYKKHECHIKKISYLEKDIRSLFSLGADVTPIRTTWYCGYVVVPNYNLKMILMVSCMAGLLMKKILKMLLF